MHLDALAASSFRTSVHEDGANGMSVDDVRARVRTCERIVQPLRARARAASSFIDARRAGARQGTNHVGRGASICTSVAQGVSTRPCTWTDGDEGHAIGSCSDKPFAAVAVLPFDVRFHSPNTHKTSRRVHSDSRLTKSTHSFHCSPRPSLREY